MASNSAEEDEISPTLTPYPNFNPREDCQVLRKAMKGLGTDEAALIKVMGHRSVDQRVEIAKQFKSMYGKDLVKEFESELSGKFLKCMKALCFPPEEFDAYQLRKAMQGMGTDEDALIEILCSRTREQLIRIIAAYAAKFPGRNLEKDLVSETSGHLKRILVSLVQANRPDCCDFDRNAARKDAQELYEAGEKELGTDESKFNEILVSRSYCHLRAVFREYKNFSKKDIEDALKSEMHGDLLEAFLAIVRCIRHKPAYFAKELKDSMKGLGTNDNKLVRIVVSRCEIDMGLIKKTFLTEYGKTLESWIIDDTSGDYKKILLTLIGSN